MIKNFESYHLQKFSDVRQAVNSLATLKERSFFELSFDDREFWFLLNEVKQTIEDRADFSDETSSVIKNLVSLIDLNLISQVDELGKDVYLLKNPAFIEQESEIILPESDEMIKLLLDIGMKNESLIRWFKVFNSFAEEEQVKIYKKLESLVVAVKELKYQLLLVCSFCHSLSGFKIYTADEFGDLLSDAEKYDLPSMLATLRDGFDNKEGIGMGRSIISMLSGESFTSLYEFDWKDNFLFSVFLIVSFKFFTLYDEEKQKFLLQNYIFRAIIAGVDVKKYLRDFILGSTDIVTYLVNHKFLFDAITINEEFVLLDVGGGERQKIKDILNNNLKYLTDDSDVLVDQIVKNITRQKIKGSYRSFVWVHEFIHLISKIKQANLVSPDDFDLSDSEKYRFDLLQLVYYFVNRERWDNVVKYYNKKEFFVPFKNFIDELASFIDINKEMAPQILLDFSDFLRKNNVAVAKKDIIIYDQQAGQFKWAQ